MIVISNTSPISNLATIGQLSLLQKLYQKILIPRAVFCELTRYEPAYLEITKANWIETKEVVNTDLVKTLQLELDPGESETIALGMELKKDVVLLLDDNKGRIIASRLKLDKIGLVGVLMQAKHKGYIPLVRPVLQDLQAKAGFWIGKQLSEELLHTVGE
jgi:predicted nucleic acid-binding protein